MPVGNCMPVSSAFCGPADDSFTDARNIPGITIEEVIPEVCKALRCNESMPADERQMRREIATCLLITMGADVLHFEGDIDPSTGIVNVDWKFTPQTKDAKLMSHAIMRVYSSRTDPRSGSKFSHLLGCEAIDMGALLQHSINVNTNRCSKDKEADYDFVLRTNFCNSFAVCSVLPCNSFDAKGQQNQLQALRQGLATYAEEEALATKEKRVPDHASNLYMPSVLAHLPDIETMVKLQQGLQQMYCVQAINKADAVLTEANGLAYAQVFFSV